MKIEKIDDSWYRAEQKILNGLLTYEVKTYASTAIKAIKKLIKKTWSTTN